MKKIIHPRLAAGTFSLVYLLFFEILEIITGFQFISKHIVILCILFIPVGVIVYYKYSATYDKENNDDKLFMIINLFGLGLFLVLSFVF